MRGKNQENRGETTPYIPFFSLLPPLTIFPSGGLYIRGEIFSPLPSLTAGRGGRDGRERRKDKRGEGREEEKGREEGEERGGGGRKREKREEEEGERERNGRRREEERGGRE